MDYSTRVLSASVSTSAFKNRSDMCSPISHNRFECKFVKFPEDSLKVFASLEILTKFLINSRLRKDFLKVLYFNFDPYIVIIAIIGKKIRFEKTLFYTSLHEKKSHTCRDSRLMEYVKSFGQLFIFKNCLANWKMVSELL
jgi:hypothetical protein